MLKCVVCGMEINDKNYNFNKSGIVGDNSETEIVSCPFCGVNSKYLVEEGDTYNVDSSLLDEETKKILDHAVKLELFNSDFYKSASELAKDEKVKELFKSLSRIERIHAKVHMRLGGFTTEPILTKLDYSKYDNDVILLEMAEKREQHAVNYYKKYIDEIDSETLRETFNAFIGVEKEHIVLVQI